MKTKINIACIAILLTATALHGDFMSSLSELKPIQAPPSSPDTIKKAVDALNPWLQSLTSGEYKATQKEELKTLTESLWYQLIVVEKLNKLVKTKAPDISKAFEDALKTGKTVYTKLITNMKNAKISLAITDGPAAGKTLPESL